MSGARRRGFGTALVIAMLVFGIAAAISWVMWRPAPDVTSALASGDYRQAVKLLEPRADAGDSNAQLVLGNLRYLGLGAATDPRAAMRLYELAAMQGAAAAQYNFALLLLNGTGIERDAVEAAAWFLLADSGGEPRAEAQLRTLAGSLSPNTLQLAEERRRVLEREIEALRLEADARSEGG